MTLSIGLYGSKERCLSVYSSFHCQHFLEVNNISKAVPGFRCEMENTSDVIPSGTCDTVKSCKQINTLNINKF